MLARLVRVFYGQNYEGCLCGPFKTKDLLLNGPVASVAIHLKQATMTDDSLTWRCNVLVTCAIGQALVYEDVFGAFGHIDSGEVLIDSDTFDSIFVGVIADIDLVRLHSWTASAICLTRFACGRTDKMKFY